MPLNEGHERFEEELGAALRRTGDGFAAGDGRELVAGGLARGRSRVVRRRLGAVTGTVLALAVVAVGGAYSGDLLGSGGAGEGSSVAASKPARDGGGQDKSARDRAVPGEKNARDKAAPADKRGATAPAGAKDLAAVLKANTPAGDWTMTHDDGAGGSVTGVYDDGKGKAGVSVALDRAPADENAAAERVTCPPKTYVRYDTCTTETLSNGDRLMVFQGYEYADKRQETKNWRAVLLTADGFLVDASEYNAPAAQGEAISRTNPPFAPSVMKTLVTADDWRPLLKKLPARNDDKPGPGTDTAPPEPNGDEVGATLRALLPTGLRVTSKGGDGQYAYVVVDDGKGKSLVQVNVQYDMGDQACALYCNGSATLPDGGFLKLTQQRGEKGGAGVVWWTVDTMDKDGFRVVVSAFNAGAQDAKATRVEPALTMAQLKAIVLDARWAKLEAK
ncbi:hypothetical protein ACFVZW_14920 [Streptomyces sp. NPDC059567]|uniref:hypothetical protein n=1 Tax=Streptomyces sp. NPDC059567 TaxID=3346867 RepID=UPI0036B4D640